MRQTNLQLSIAIHTCISAAHSYIISKQPDYENGRGDRTWDGDVIDVDEEEERGEDSSLRNTSSDIEPVRLLRTNNDANATINKECTNPSITPTVDTNPA